MVVSKVLTIHRKRDGIYVSGTSEQYYLSESSTELVGGEWKDTFSYEAGKYVWTREKHEWSDGRDASYGEPHLNEYIALIGKKATYIGEDGVYTGTLSADTIAAIQIAASKITAGKLSAEVELEAKKGTIGGWTIKEEETTGLLKDDRSDSGVYGLFGTAFFSSLPGVYLQQKNTNNEKESCSLSPNGLYIGKGDFNSTTSIELKSDGSGKLASGNISWDANGELKVDYKKPAGTGANDGNYIVHIDGEEIKLGGDGEVSQRTIISRGGIEVKDQQLQSSTKIGVHGTETDRPIRSKDELRFVTDLTDEDYDEEGEPTTNIRVKLDGSGVTYWNEDIGGFETIPWQALSALIN